MAKNTFTSLSDITDSRAERRYREQSYNRTLFEQLIGLALTTWRANGRYQYRFCRYYWSTIEESKQQSMGNHTEKYANRTGTTQCLAKQGLRAL